MVHSWWCTGFIKALLYFQIWVVQEFCHFQVSHLLGKYSLSLYLSVSLSCGCLVVCVTALTPLSGIFVFLHLKTLESWNHCNLAWPCFQPSCSVSSLCLHRQLFRCSQPCPKQDAIIMSSRCAASGIHLHMHETWPLLEGNKTHSGKGMSFDAVFGIFSINHSHWLKWIAFLVSFHLKSDVKIQLLILDHQ